MLLSNPNIDYSSVRRMPTVKLSGQTQGTTTNTMPTSTSLQDISSHHAQKFNWNNNNNNNNNNQDQRLVSFSENVLTSSINRPLNASQSDERIFEHPEVTIKPSALDDELHRRLLTLKTSNTTENFLENNAGKSAPNILEHPDMRAPVVMQPQQIPSSLSSSALLIHDYKRVSRTQSDDTYKTFARTPSPRKHVDFYIDNQQNSKPSTSPGSYIGDIIESPEQERNEDLHSSSLITGESSETSSKSDNNSLKTKKNDSW